MMAEGRFQFLAGVFLLLVILAAGCSKKDTSRPPRILAKYPHCYEAPPLRALGLSAIFDEHGYKLPDTEVNIPEVAWAVLDAESHKFYSGVGRYGNCTGTLLDTTDDSSAPAYVLTNGHCVTSGSMAPSGYLSDAPESPSRKMHFNYYKGFTPATLITVSVKKISFASMDKTDAALVELNASLGELKDRGICPFRLGEAKPVSGQKIQVVGVPLTGMLPENQGLRLSICTAGGTVALREGEYTFPDSFRHQCSAVGGSSGSPVFEPRDFSIVGLVNTSINDSAAAEASCSLNKPCEVSESGEIITNTKDNYAQKIDYLVGCFDRFGFFDLRLSTCGIKAKFSD